jgi:hypothetical protein
MGWLLTERVFCFVINDTSSYQIASTRHQQNAPFRRSSEEFSIDLKLLV